MPDCNKCKEEHGLVTIPYIAHESAMARLERTIKRLWVLILLMVVLFVGSNVAWIIYESQFETVETVDVEQDVEWDDGSNVIVNGTGGVNINGQSTSDGDLHETQNP